MSAPLYWSTASKIQLVETHILLQLLFSRVLARPDCPHDLAVVCGHRGKDDQDRLYAEGKSKVKWPHSKHNNLPSLAIDVVPWVDGKLSWAISDMQDVAGIVKAEWATMKAEGRVYPGVELEWGGDWAWQDGAHWQLSGR